MAKKEIATVADAEALALLAAQYPQEAGFSRLMLPRLAFKSQDVMEGVGKAKKVVIEAGTFFTERPTEEKDADGKAVWEKKELGISIEAYLVYPRKQLRFYDEPNEQYYSTPIYDKETDIIPLFCGRNKVATGTPAQLKKSFEYTTPEGKVKSKLEDNVVLYVWYEGELYQLGLRGSSMYSFKGYERKVAPPTVLTSLTSSPEEKGSIKWNRMEFAAVRQITPEEAVIILEQQALIRDAIEAEKAYYANQAQDDSVTAAVVAAIAAPVDEEF